MKKNYLIFAIVVVITSLVGCINVLENTISVTGISLDYSNISIQLDNTYQLNLIFTPENATNRECSWSSSNNSIASVSNSGLVSALALGQTTISVTSSDGEFSDSCVVSIISNISKIAMITDSGSITDESYNQGVWEGMLKADDQFDIDIQYQIPDGTEKVDYLAKIDDLYQDNYRFFITPGFKFETTIYDAQFTYTDAKFVLIDGIPHPGNYSSTVRENTVSIFFTEHESGFIAGVATALQLFDGTAGFIGGMVIPPVEKFNWGFQQGIQYANDNYNTTITMSPENIIYQGTFSDVDGGQALASQMFDNGVDVIFCAAGGVGIGAINEAKERALNSEEVWIVGVDVDQYSLGIYQNNESVILTSAIKKIDVVAFEMIEHYLEDTLPGGEVLIYDVSNNGVGIPDNNPNLDLSVENTVSDVVDLIISGDIVVSDDIESGTMSFRIIPNDIALVNGIYPAELDYPVATIVEIIPAINGKEIYISDDNGNVLVENVPAGNYSIHPVFFDTTSDFTLTVTDEVTTDIDTVLLPNLGAIYYYTFNLTGSGNTDLTTEVRIALSKYLNRQDLLDSIASDKTPAYNLIPYNHMFDGLESVESIIEETTWADTNLSILTPIDFNILYNTTDSNLDLANGFKDQIDIMTEIGIITLTDQVWDTYITTKVDMAFEVARSGWGFESNNFIDYFQALVDESGYSNASFASLILAAESALTSGSLDQYIDNIISIHNLLLSEMIIIPIYDY